MFHRERLQVSIAPPPFGKLRLNYAERPGCSLLCAVARTLFLSLLQRGIMSEKHAFVTG
jgi:hypothetical protein